MSPADRAQALLVLGYLGEHGPSTAEQAGASLPKMARRHATGRLLQAQAEGWATPAGQTRTGATLWALTPAGVAWLELHDNPSAADAAE